MKVLADHNSYGADSEIPSDHSITNNPPIFELKIKQSIEEEERINNSSISLFSCIKVRYKPGIFDIWALGMTTVLGGVYYGWNEGLHAGFGSYLIAQVLMGIAFIILICSLAEIISTTSFSGGAFGMARVVLGFYPGFLVACFELLEYIFYVSATVQFAAAFVQDKLHINDTYEPIVCLVFYILFAVLLFDGNQVYWRFNAVMGVGCFLILVIFCFGSLAYTDLPHNASLRRNGENNSALINWFSGGLPYFLQALPFATWGFGGIECAALVTDMVENSRKTTSKGMVYGVVTLFVLVIFVMFVACSSFDHGLNEYREVEFLLNPGFMKMGMSYRDAQWMIIPAQIASSFGFLIPASKLIQSMSHSQLIPQNIALNLPSCCASKLWSLVLSYCVFLIAFYYNPFVLVNIPILFSMITYLSDLYAYYRLQTDLNSAAEKEFVSPFGVAGALFAGIIFTACLLAVCIYDFSALIVVVGITIVLSIYYFTYAKHKQKFSEQEQKTLLNFHVIQTNRRRRLKRPVAHVTHFAFHVPRMTSAPITPIK
eukprot:gene6942-7489_t